MPVTFNIECRKIVMLLGQIPTILPSIRIVSRDFRLSATKMHRNASEWNTAQQSIAMLLNREGQNLVYLLNGTRKCTAHVM